MGSWADSIYACRLVLSEVPGALGAPSKGIIGTPGCLPLQPGPTNTQSVDCCVGTQADQHSPGCLPFQLGPVSTSGVDCSCMSTQAMLHQIPTTPLVVRAAKGGGGLCALCLRGSPCAQDGVGIKLSNSQGVNANHTLKISRRQCQPLLPLWAVKGI